MELLAPAGTKENFMAALEAGADAIYLGGKVFNARANAGNFTIDELTEAVKTAHILGTAIYVTVNILMGDHELKELEKYLKILDTIGVDAVIVQDLATAELAKKVAPRLAIHGSTQMTAANLGTVEFLRGQGFSRVVLARELSLEEIAYICHNTTAEIEVFVHGALCICYSGQCLMSSFIGGRSGNRGACAQPCRLPYELYNSAGQSQLPKEQAYILSPKDLNYADHMKELEAAGVYSIKIEGRMKKVSYVREVVGSYRSVLDQGGKAGKADLERLNLGFNRGFSQAYLEGNSGKKMMTMVAPNNQGKEIGYAHSQGLKMRLSLNSELTAGQLLKIISQNGSVKYYTVTQNWLEGLLANSPKNNGQSGKNKAKANANANANENKPETVEYIVAPGEEPVDGVVYLAATGQNQKEHSNLAHFNRKIPVFIYLDGQEGERVHATFLTEAGDSVTITNEYILEIARTSPTTLEKIAEQMGRMGNSLFQLAEVAIPEGPFMWPASVLNQLRREGLEKMESVLLERFRLEHVGHQESVNTRALALGKNQKYNFSKVKTMPSPIVSVRCGEWEEVKAAVESGADKIIFAGDRYKRIPYEKEIYSKVVTYCHENDVFVAMATPRVVRAGEEIEYKKVLSDIVLAKPDSIAIHFLGALEWLNEMEYDGAVEADTSLNVFNSEALLYLVRLGVSSFAVSEEATLEQIRRMATATSAPLECMVQGRAELMVSEYCAIGAFKGNGAKKNCPMPCRYDSYFLKDRKGILFPLQTDPYCRMHILNSSETDMRPYIDDLKRKNVRIFRIEGRGQTVKYISDMVRQYKSLLAGTAPPVSKETKQSDSVTRGHYFKGIF